MLHAFGRWRRWTVLACVLLAITFTAAWFYNYNDPRGRMLHVGPRYWLLASQHDGLTLASLPDTRIPAISWGQDVAVIVQQWGPIPQPYFGSFALYKNEPRSLIPIVSTPQGTPSYDVYLSGVCFPHWLAIALCSVIPMIALARHLLIRSAAPGHCPQCNYDLQATPTRCPECGHEA